MAEHALLFTDLVDSTAVVERLGDARAASVFAEHDRSARALLACHGGREIDHSDGFFLLFADVVAAASFALAYHEVLAALGLSSRAGVHVGPVTLRENDPEEVARGAKQVEVEGIAKPLAARVMSLARGGQTLLTQAACAALGDALANAAAIESHGHYRLKGIAEPVELFELGVRDRSSFAPPGDSEKAARVVRAEDGWRPVREVRHNLPRERDAFVGRAADLAAVAARFDAGARVLTVLGPGGTGKTRLARHYGRSWMGDWPGGVYFCDLSDARTLEGVFFVVALALDVPLGKGDDPGVQLGHAIATRGRCLVILDNFEQVVEHAEATIGRWANRASEAGFLVTSRERLRLAGEDVLPLEPLPIDADGVELFALRARAQRTDFALTPTNRAVVQRIVALLDGLPLAIELAAARIRVLSPAQLVERLADRFTLLAGARSAADRQATLRGAIDWSWNLLLPWEQAALAQCSVFEGGFTLDAAEAVLDLSSWTDAPPIVDAVQTLVDKSLLRTWIPVDQVRHALEELYFGMYLTIHEYAAEKLAASGADRQRAAQEAHGRHFARFGSDEHLLTLDRHDGGARRRALALELDNLVAACKRAVAQGGGATAVATLRAAWAAVSTQGPFDLVIDLGMQVDGLPQIEPTLRAAALTVVGRAIVATGRPAQAVPLFERALALARSANDTSREAKVLSRLANAERQQGRMDEARHHAEWALALHAALGQTEGHPLYELGIVQRQTGAMQEARATYEHALAIYRQQGNGNGEAKVLNSLAIIHAEQGRFDEACAHFERALSISREQGDRRQEGLVLGNLGSLNMEQGRLEMGREQSEAALAIHRDTGERIEEGQTLANIAMIDKAEGRVEAALGNFFAALAIARDASNRRQEGVVLGCLGALESESGQLDEARLHYDQALAIHRSVGNRHDEGAVLTQLAGLLTQQGRNEEAIALLAQAEVHLRAVGKTLSLTQLFCLRGRLLLSAGESDRAQQTLEEAQEGAQAMNLDPGSTLWQEIAALRQALDAAPPTAR